METVFLVCAVLGSTVMVCQFLLTMLGMAGHGVAEHAGADAAHHDVGHHAAHGHGADADGHQQENLSNWFLSMLSFRTITAAVAFFGLGGMAMSANSPEGNLMPLLVAMASGIGAMLLVGYVMKSLHRLHSEGTVHLNRAVGSMGTVYLTIPGQRSGAGKVTLTLQNRTMEYQAVTSQSRELTTGTKVKVVAVVAPGTVDVEPLS